VYADSVAAMTRNQRPPFDAVRQGGGNSRGLRSGPTATYVRLASVTFTVISLPGLRCAYTSTATVIDVRPTFVISAKNDTTSPTKTGCLKMNELTATVATRPQARWEAGMAPATSTCDMIQPPKISPWKFASAGIGTTRSTGQFDGSGTLSSIVPWLKRLAPQLCGLRRAIRGAVSCRRS